MGAVRVPKRRMFIGIRIPAHVADLIDDVQESIEPYFDGSFTPPQNLHVTLKFLGEIDERTITRVNDLLERVDFEPGSAMIDRFGTFSKRIVWAHVAGLEELHQQVDNALLGVFTSESRFMSHLTIARMRRVRNAPGLRACLKAFQTNVSWHVHRVELIESRLDDHGAEYTTIAGYATHQDLLI